MTIVQELKDLVALKGDVTADEFQKAKTLLFAEHSGGGHVGHFQPGDNTDDFKEKANATNRPLAKGKKYRRRSIQDWMARAIKDLNSQLEDAAESPDLRKVAFLKVSQDCNAAYSPTGDSKGITAETITDAHKRFWTEDAYIDYIGEGWGCIGGRFLVSTGQAGKVLNMFTQSGEYHFDFAKATISAFDSILTMDMSWYKIVSNKTKKAYEVQNKAAYTFNKEGTKISSLICYFEEAGDYKGFQEYLKDDDFEAKIKAAGIKKDGDGNTVGSYVKAAES